jgi:hypothetical protein
MPTQQKITFGEMRAFGARRIVVFCSDYRGRLDYPACRSLVGSCQAVGYRVAVRLKGLRQLSSSVTVCRRTADVNGRSYLAWPWLRRRLRPARLDLG